MEKKFRGKGLVSLAGQLQENGGVRRIQGEWTLYHGESGGGITGAFRIKEDDKRWTGIFENRGKKARQWMCLYVTLDEENPGKVTGEGRDAVGKFNLIDGKIIKKDLHRVFKFGRKYLEADHTEWFQTEWDEPEPKKEEEQKKEE